MKKYIYKLILLSLLCHVGCNNEPKKENVEKPKTELNCNPVQNNIICIPKEWKVIKQSELFFFAAPQSDYKYTFFTVGKYNLKSSNLELKSYLKAVYKELRAKNKEAFTGYTLKKITFEDKTSYYAEYFSKVDNVDYIAYSILFEKEGFLYDIFLKREKNSTVPYKAIFNEIVFNFKVDGIQIFYEEDEIKKTEVIDLSKL
jgi:hypothetical protein